MRYTPRGRPSHDIVTPDDLIVWATPEQQAAALRTVCDYATDADDARELLAMLGLEP